MSELNYIQKGPKSVNGQYRYASHDQVTAAIHPFLVKYGVTALPTVTAHTQEGNRTTVDLRVVFTNADDPNDAIAISCFGYGVDPGDKGPGKAVSYAFKVACLKALALETGEDPDEDANAVYEPPKCQEFDSLVSMWSEKDKERLDQFLSHSSVALKKHVEDVKREAVSRFDDFIAAYKKWNPGVKTREVKAKG